MKNVTAAGVTFPMDKYPHIEFGVSGIVPMYGDGRAHDFEKATGKPINRCEVCHTWFFTSRRHAKFCTPNCRKAHSRRKDKFKREVKKMHIAIRTVRRLYDQWPDLEEFMLTEIRGAIEM